MHQSEDSSAKGWTKTLFSELSDQQFEDRAEASIAKLHVAHTRDDANSVYRKEVLPLEYERVVREARQRKMDSKEDLELLFVTVGAQGDSPALAVLASPASFVVLLHTEESRASAEEVVQKLGLLAHQATLLSIGDGKNPLVLYRAIFNCWEKRNRPSRVAVDLTGGLKTMSAAAASAGFALPGASVYYVDADQRRYHDATYWIRQKRLCLDNPFEVFGDIRRKAAVLLLHNRKYGEAALAFEELQRMAADPEPDEIRAKLAKGYNAIERLDFKLGVEVLAELHQRLEFLSQFYGRDPLVQYREHVAGNLEGVKSLALVVAGMSGNQELDPGNNLKALMSSGLLDLVAMLLAAANRHHLNKEYDIAALLAYRAMELIPQRRLACKGGIDPAEVDWEKLAKSADVSIEDMVSRFNKVAKKEEHYLNKDNMPKRVSRTTSFALIKSLFPDDVAKEFDFEKFAGIGKARNRSILAHGIQKLDEVKTKSIIEYASALASRLFKVEGISDDDANRIKQRHQFLSTEL